MANKVIKSLNPTNYNGTFEAAVEGYKVSGNLSTNGQKVLSNVSGSVKSGETIVANFNGYSNGPQGKIRYDFRDVTDLSQLSAIASAVSSVVTEIETELTSE